MEITVRGGVAARERPPIGRSATRGLMIAVYLTVEAYDPLGDVHG